VGGLRDFLWFPPNKKRNPKMDDGKKEEGETKQQHGSMKKSASNPEHKLLKKVRSLRVVDRMSARSLDLVFTHRGEHQLDTSNASEAKPSMIKPTESHEAVAFFVVSPSRAHSEGLSSDALSSPAPPVPLLATADSGELIQGMEWERIVAESSMLDLFDRRPERSGSRDSAGYSDTDGEYAGSRVLGETAWKESSSAHLVDPEHTSAKAEERPQTAPARAAPREPIVQVGRGFSVLIDEPIRQRGAHLSAKRAPSRNSARSAPFVGRVYADREKIVWHAVFVPDDYDSDDEDISYHDHVGAERQVTFVDLARKRAVVQLGGSLDQKQQVPETTPSEEIPDSRPGTSYVDLGEWDEFDKFNECCVDVAGVVFEFAVESSATVFYDFVRLQVEEERERRLSALRKEKLPLKRETQKRADKSDSSCSEDESQDQDSFVIPQLHPSYRFSRIPFPWPQNVVGTGSAVHSWLIEAAIGDDARKFTKRLRKAAEGGEVKRLEKILAREVEATDRALQENDCLDNLQRALLSRFALCAPLDKSQCTVLHIAASHNHLALVEWIVRRCEQTAKNSAAVFDSLVEISLALVSQHDSYRAIASSAFARFDFFPVDVNALDRQGWSPIHSAAHGGVLRIVKRVCQAGADASLPTVDGSTALHLLAKHDWFSGPKSSKSSSSRFLNAVRAETDNQPSALAQLAKEDDALFFRQFFEKFAPEEDEDLPSEVVQMLRAAGADIDARNANGETPLQLSCFFGHKSNIVVLLRNGSFIFNVNSRGERPIEYARHRHQGKVVQLLQEMEDLLEGFVTLFPRSVVRFSLLSRSPPLFPSPLKLTLVSQMIRVFSFLEPRDLGRVALVCKVFQDVSEDNSLWRRHCGVSDDDEDDDDAALPKHWVHVYRNRFGAASRFTSFEEGDFRWWRSLDERRSETKLMQSKLADHLRVQSDLYCDITCKIVAVGDVDVGTCACSFLFVVVAFDAYVFSLPGKTSLFKRFATEMFEPDRYGLAPDAGMCM
jgi:ankyrin repeat protein